MKMHASRSVLVCMYTVCGIQKIITSLPVLCPWSYMFQAEFQEALYKKSPSVS